MYLLGIDIGGTKCAVTLGKNAAEADKLIVDKLAFESRASERGALEIIDEIMKSADILLNKNGVSANELSGIGISCGGPLDSKSGMILSPPNLPGWDELPIVEMFEKRFGVKTNLQNDANACAVAEWKYGAAQGYNNIIFLTFGTGMGAGLILDGKLYSGTSDMAGEVGHIRLDSDGPEGYGKRGSFEGFCSGGGIARMAREMISEAKAEGLNSPLFNDEKTINAKILSIAAANGDKFAQKVYARCGEKLGLGLSILIDILNPEIIVIGSIYERNREMFDAMIAPLIEKEALIHSRAVCKIAPAVLGDSIGDYAALSLAAGNY